MPAIKEGETEDEYVKRCIPERIKEGDTSEQATAVCHGMYKQHQKKGTQYSSFEPPASGDLLEAGKKILSKVYSECRQKWVDEHPDDKENHINKESCAKIAWSAVHKAGYQNNMELFHDDKRLYILDSTGEYKPDIDNKTNIIEINKDNSYHATCLIGDRFYKNKFLSNKELQKAFQSFNRSVHDINHWSTTYLDGHPNIEYVLGYQDNVKFDGQKMTADIHINPSAPKYSVWKNYIDICRQAGRIPNVSVAFWASSQPIKTNELPAGVDYHQYGYNDNDMIPSITDIDFKALATVLEGSCNDKDGCGIGIGYDKNKPFYVLEVTEKMTKEEIIQKCKEDMRKNHPELSEEQINRACDMKIEPSGIGGEDGQGGNGGKQDTDKDIKNLTKLDTNKVYNIEIEKNKNLLMKKKKLLMEEK